MGIPGWMEACGKRDQVYLLPNSLPGSVLGALNTGMADSLAAEVEPRWEELTGMNQTLFPWAVTTLLHVPL